MKKIKFSVLLSVVLVALLFCTIALARDIPVELWFDEGSGSETQNHGSSGWSSYTLRDGLDTGDGISVGPAWSADTPFAYEGNYSLYLDDGSHNVNLGTDAQFSVHNFTIECWIKPEQADAVYRYIVQAFDANGVKLHYRLHQIEGNWELEALFWNYNTDGWMVLRSAEAAIVMDEWQHVALCYDENGGGQLFVNGIEVAHCDPVAPFYLNRYWRIGNPTANALQGRIDEFRISDFARIRGYGSGVDSSLAWNASLTDLMSAGPELIAPVDSTIVGPEPTLRWFSVPEADGYQIQVSSTPDFSLLTCDQSGHPDTSLVLGGLAVNTSYFWRVRGLWESGFSKWSVSEVFVTNAISSGEDRIGVLAPDFASAGEEGSDCFDFVKTVMDESSISYDVIPFSYITDRTHPDVLQDYDLLVVPFLACPRVILVQTAIRNFFYTGGKVISFALAGAYVQNLSYYLYGLKTLGSYINISNPVLQRDSQYAELLPDSTVILESTTQFVAHSPELFDPKVLMSIEFASKQYPAVVMARDHSAAYFAIPLSGNGESDAVRGRKDLFATVLDSVRAAERDTVTLPETVEAIDYGVPKSIEFDQDELYINGNPFYAHGVGYLDLIPGSTPLSSVENWISDYAFHHFNAIVMYMRFREGWFEYYEDCLDICQEHGIQVMLYFHDKWSTTPWRDEWTLELMRMRNHPALLGYCLVDDTEWWHFPAVKRWSDLIRRYDTTNLLTCTLLDFRKPNAVADAGSWDQWQEWFHESHNFPLTYLYPLMRDGNYVNPVIDGGIEDIARLAEHVNEQVGYSYHHQWLQAHMQGFAYGDFGLGTWETFVASPEQLRLEMYTGLLANVKGIYLFSHQSLRDANLGRGRRNESGIVFREFDLVNDFITVGTLQDYPGESPHPQISIRSFTLADEELLVLLRHDPDYIRYVGDSTLYSLSIPLSAAKSAYRVEFPAIRPLAVTNNTVQLDSLDLTAVILLTNDSANIDSLQATIDAWMPDLASEALEVSRDKRAKTEVIAEKIATARELPAGIEALFDKGRQVYGQARWDFANQAYTASYQRSRTATLIYRKIQRLMMQQAEAYWQENLSGNQTAREYLIYFFGLPKFYERYANGSSVLQGELGTAIISRLHAFDNASATDEATTLPARVRLLPNYPNPFNGSTLIRYELSEKTSVRLSIFNLCGQLVDTLIVEDQPQGYHQWHFDAGKLPSGVYFCQLQTGSVLQKLKILLLK